MARMCGGIGRELDATDEVHELVAKVRGEAVKKLGVNGPEFSAIKYATQVVAGTNFFIKVSLGDGNYAHLRVFRPLPGQGEVQLAGVQPNHTLDSRIDHF